MVVSAEDALGQEGLQRGFVKRRAADVVRIAESRDLICVFGRRDLDGGGEGGMVSEWRRCRPWWGKYRFVLYSLKLRMIFAYESEGQSIVMPEVECQKGGIRVLAPIVVPNVGLFLGVMGELELSLGVGEEGLGQCGPCKARTCSIDRVVLRLVDGTGWE